MSERTFCDRCGNEMTGLEPTHGTLRDVGDFEIGYEVAFADADAHSQFRTPDVCVPCAIALLGKLA